MTGVPPEQPQQEPVGPSRERGGGSVVLGIVVGVLFFAAAVALTTWLASWSGTAWIANLAVVAYLVVAIVLTTRRRTVRFGTGLLIAIGISLLIAAGVCVALIASIGQA